MQPGSEECTDLQLWLENQVIGKLSLGLINALYVLLLCQEKVLKLKGDSHWTSRTL